MQSGYPEPEVECGSLDWQQAPPQIILQGNRLWIGSWKVVTGSAKIVDIGQQMFAVQLPGQRLCLLFDR